MTLSTHRGRSLAARRHLYGSNSQSIWPDWAQGLFRALAEIPWGSLTAIAIVSGAALQFAYFRSIQYAPTDYLAITSVAAATAAAALTMAVGIGTLISFPAIVARAYDDESSSNHQLFTPTEVLCAQTSVAAFIVAYYGYENARDCGTSVGTFVFVAAIISFISLICVVDQAATTDARRRSLARFAHLSAVGLMGLTPILALIPLFRMIKGGWLDGSWFLLSMWLLLMTFNAWTMNTRAKLGGLLLAGGVLAVFLYAVLPIALDKSNDSLAAVAEFMGVRSEGSVTLLLTEQGCKVASAATNSPSNGCSATEPNAREATVLSNIGSRWVLALRQQGQANGKDDSQSEVIQVTLPADNIQVVMRRPTSKTRPSCKHG